MVNIDARSWCRILAYLVPHYSAGYYIYINVYKQVIFSFCTWILHFEWTVLYCMYPTSIQPPSYLILQWQHITSTTQWKKSTVAVKTKQELQILFWLHLFVCYFGCSSFHWWSRLCEFSAPPNVTAQTSYFNQDNTTILKETLTHTFSFILWTVWGYIRSTMYWKWRMKEKMLMWGLQ